MSLLTSMSAPHETEALEYVVEMILSARRTEEPMHSEYTNPESDSFGGGWEYLIKWEGYADDENTWEPIGHLHCRTLLLDFWQEIGHESLPTSALVELRPRPEWIAQKNIGSVQDKDREQKRQKKVAPSRSPSRRDTAAECRRTTARKKTHIPQTSSPKKRTPKKPSRRVPTSTPPHQMLSDPSFESPLIPNPKLATTMQAECKRPASHSPGVPDVVADPLPTLVPDDNAHHTRASSDAYLHLWPTAPSGQESDLLLAPIVSETSLLGAQSSWPLTNDLGLLTPDPDLADHLLGLSSDAFLN
ncbi:hypothetical protein GGX14DRAFT_697826 [Mycena pura]|uniref:Chromo domain-containing protein n=1 Tax=Mycena pura TaxID=153505 RepID=A0AAD6YBF5_9AGAR|nr:hypothetical protein GGX14DRAFT_697826 [Mycena pura]